MLKVTRVHKNGETQQVEGAVGLGDLIARLTKKVGIKPCGKCKKRQQYLNERFQIRGS